MTHEAISILSAAFRENLQDKLEDVAALAGREPIKVDDILDPYTDNDLTPVNPRTVVIDLGPLDSPRADFKVFEKVDVSIPVVVQYILKAGSDTADVRREVSDAERAILHVLSDLVMSQGIEASVRLIELEDLIFEMVRYDSEHVGGALFFYARMRDETP